MKNRFEIGVLIWAAIVAFVILVATTHAKEPCAQAIHESKTERHTTTTQKRMVFARAGVPYDKHNRPMYVVDHVIPLELGGLDEVANMQLQTVEAGHAKDRIENFLARCVYCTHETKLPLAQKWVILWTQVAVDRPCPTSPPPMVPIP